MKALRLVDWKTDPELVEVPKPTPGPGEVIVRIGGAGACHTDLHVMHDFEPGMMPWKVPFTLGHENAGWVDSVGDGVRSVVEGDAVAVYGAWVAAGAAGASRASRTTARIRPRHRS
jgi:propanol-preferring alcohol dehydrogenase